MLDSASTLEERKPDRIEYLDRLAATDEGRLYKAQMLSLLNAQPGHRVVDLGCGPGTDLNVLAEVVTTSGYVIGIDNNASMINKAREQTVHHPGVKVILGDAHALPLEDSSIDRIRTDRVLQHVEDPSQVLADMHRVLRPGARVVTGEPDWDTLAIDYPNVEVSRAYTRHITDNLIKNPNIGRQLPRLFINAGFSIISVIPIVGLYRDIRAADRVLGLKRNTQRAVDTGYISPEAAKGWLEYLTTEPFLAAVTFYIIVAEVPM